MAYSSVAGRKPSPGRGAGRGGGGGRGGSGGGGGRGGGSVVRVRSDAPRGGADSAFLFLCDASTRPQCLSLALFGSPRQALRDMHDLDADVSLYLYDTSAKDIMGPYRAVPPAQLDIIPDAYAPRSFPAQVWMLPSSRWFAHLIRSAPNPLPLTTYLPTELTTGPRRPARPPPSLHIH